MNHNRRKFLHSALGASGAVLLGSSIGAQEQRAALPDPEKSGIDHIVVVTMENRSFDHLLGWLPNADGKQAGLTYTDSEGRQQRTQSLSGNYTGCGHPDPDHSYAGGRVQYNAGAMDGFLRSGSNDGFAISYYGAFDNPFYTQLALNYTSFDRYFCSILGPTFPNRVFLHGAQTDRLSNSFDISDVPTIWDRLSAAGISARYYYSNLPFLALWGTRYLRISGFYLEFLIEAALGLLPHVSFIDPRYTTIDAGDGNDDHPHADLRAGDAFLSEVFHAVSSGPKWKRTVLIVNWDEWGGFFDHVHPPRAAAPNATDGDLVDGKALLGFRVPTVIASPFTRGNPANPRVMHGVYDNTSILKFIEWRFGLEPLTERDGSNDVGNLAEALDFTYPQADVPSLPRVSPPSPSACFGLFSSALSEEEVSSGMSGLARSRLMQKWPLQGRDMSKR